jgi:hypothetical protein
MRDPVCPLIGIDSHDGVEGGHAAVQEGGGVRCFVSDVYGPQSEPYLLLTHHSLQPKLSDHDGPNQLSDVKNLTQHIEHIIHQRSVRA